jgi:DNA-binding NtrC family response regulator
MATILLIDNDPFQASLRKSLLDRAFSNVQRVGDPVEALCLVEQPRFAEKLGLVISGHDTPGLSGPAFVAELHTRMPFLPVLVLGGNSDTAADYAGDRVRFLSRSASGEEMLSLAGEMLAFRVLKTA